MDPSMYHLGSIYVHCLSLSTKINVNIFKEVKITRYQVLICTFVFTEVGSLQVSRIVTPHTQT